MKDGLPGYPTDRMKVAYLLAAVERLQAEVAALKKKSKAKRKAKPVRVAA